MNKRLFTLLLPLLCACASPGATGNNAGAQPDTETLALTRLEPHAMEVQLDGTRYSGEWADAQCFTDPCRGEFRNVPRMYRRHIRHGESELMASNGDRMICEWVSYRDRISGTCQTRDGRTHALKAEGG